MGPSVIGNFDKPAKTDPLTWMVKHSDKVALCSSARALAGGSVAGDGVEADPGPKGKEIAPFNFRGMKPKVYDEITSGANGAAIVDLASCNGLLPLHALVKDTPYFGACYSEDHKA